MVYSNNDQHGVDISEVGVSAKRADSLPVELRVLLKDITEAISAISRGDDPEKQMESLYRATDGAVRTASSMAPHPPLTWGTPLPARFGDIIGDNIRALRVEAGWSQEQLANAMATAGTATAKRRRSCRWSRAISPTPGK